jgi:hypothetical protein
MKTGPKPQTTHPHAHHLVQFITEQADRQGVSWEALGRAASINDRTLRRWRTNATVPDVFDIERVLSALGFNLVPIMKGDK